MSEKRLHLNHLDGVRGLSALYVVFAHSVRQVSPNMLVGDFTASQWKITSLFLFPRFAVDMFIILSGFVLMIPPSRSNLELKGGVGLFLKKRFVRIVPTYYAALALSLVLIALWIGSKTGTHWDVALPVTPFGVLTHLLLIQDIFPSTYGQINHVMWSISVEWRIYFLFPLLLICWKRLGPWATVSATVLFSFALSHVLRDAPIAYSGTVEYFGLFAIGMLGADVVFRRTDPEKLKSAKVKWGAGFFIALAAFIGINVIQLSGSLFYDLAFSICGVCLLVYTSLSPHSLVSRALSWKPIRALGVAGYSLYLIHAPLLQLIQQYLLAGRFTSNFSMFLALVAIGIPLILLATWGFYSLVEKRFVVLNQKISSKSRQSAP